MTETVEHPSLPIDCAAWCTRGPQDHEADPSPAWEDRTACFGPEHVTPLSRYASLRVTDGTYQPDYLIVYAMRNEPGEAPYVFLGRGEDAALVQLSPGDAARLRDSLSQALGDIGYVTD